MGDGSCDILIKRLHGDAVFTLFSKAVTVVLEEVLMQTRPAAPLKDTALSHLKRFSASGRTADLKAVVALARQDK
jgi:hypothetical protein